MTSSYLSSSFTGIWFAWSSVFGMLTSLTDCNHCFTRLNDAVNGGGAVFLTGFDVDLQIFGVGVHPVTSCDVVVDGASGEPGGPHDFEFKMNDLPRWWSSKCFLISSSGRQGAV